MPPFCVVLIVFRHSQPQGRRLGRKGWPASQRAQQTHGNSGKRRVNTSVRLFSFPGPTQRTEALCCSHRQNELKEGAQRSVGRQYFYVDYKHFCNVVKWRVAEMHRVIDTGLRNVSTIYDWCIHAVVPPTQLIRPSNSTTKGIYARCAAGRTPH